MAFPQLRSRQILSTREGVPGAKDLTPSLFTNAQDFPAPEVTVGAVTLSPGLFTNAQAFPSATVDGGAVTLSPSLFTNTQDFPAASISTTVGIAPSLFTNAQDFPAPTVSVGAVTLSPELFTNAQVFPDILLVQAAPQDLLPDLFTNYQVFPTHVLTGGLQTIQDYSGGYADHPFLKPPRRRKDKRDDDEEEIKQRALLELAAIEHAIEKARKKGKKSNFAQLSLEDIASRRAIAKMAVEDRIALQAKIEAVQRKQRIMREDDELMQLF